MAIAPSWLQQHSCLGGTTQEKTLKAHTFFRDLWLADLGTLKYISDTARRTFFRFFETSLPNVAVLYFCLSVYFKEIFPLPPSDMKTS